MKKTLTFLLVVSLILISFTPQQVKAENTRDLVAATYLSQVGVSEATGHNDGIMVETYLMSTNLPAGNPWCGAFVNWCFEQNGIEGPDGAAYSPTWFPAKRLINNPPKRADVFGIYFNSKGRIAHVGFIESWNGTYAITVEGNTNDAGSRDGGAVLKKRRLTRQIYTTCDWISYRQKPFNA